MVGVAVGVRGHALCLYGQLLAVNVLNCESWALPETSLNELRVKKHELKRELRTDYTDCGRKINSKLSLPLKSGFS